MGQVYGVRWRLFRTVAIGEIYFPLVLGRNVSLFLRTVNFFPTYTFLKILLFLPLPCFDTGHVCEFEFYLGNQTTYILLLSIDNLTFNGENSLLLFFNILRTFQLLLVDYSSSIRSDISHLFILSDYKVHFYNVREISFV